MTEKQLKDILNQMSREELEEKAFEAILGNARLKRIIDKQSKLIKASREVLSFSIKTSEKGQDLIEKIIKS